MKRSIINTQEQKNCEEWLSTRNRKKICPSVASKTLIAHKLASFPFTSKYKLTQNSSSPSKQLIIPQHQTSILNYVKKDKITWHQEKQNVSAIKKLFQEKEMISEFQKKNTGSPPKTMAGSPTHKECKFENVLHLTKPCSDTEEKRLEEIQEKIKDCYEKSNKENIFSESDIINVETHKSKKRSIKNVFIDSDRSAILLNKTNVSPSKTLYISDSDYLTCSNRQNSSILNKFESQVNKLPSNPQKKIATTPTKYIKSVNPNLQDSQRISGLKHLKYSLDCNNDMTNLYDECEKKVNAQDQEFFRSNLDISPSKQILETYLKDNCSQVSSIDNTLLKQKTYMQKNMVNACLPNEFFHLNPAHQMEQKLSNSSYDKTELFNENIARDSPLDISENNLDLSFPIHIENSEQSSKKNVFSNFQIDQILDLAKGSNSSTTQYEEIIAPNANSILPEEMALTQSLNAVNKYTEGEPDFETAAKSEANTSHCFTGFFETMQASKQEHSNEHLNFEEDNLEFTLHSQRSIDEEIPHEFMQETDNFTFNSDFT